MILPALVLWTSECDLFLNLEKMNDTSHWIPITLSLWSQQRKTLFPVPNIMETMYSIHSSTGTHSALIDLRKSGLLSAYVISLSNAIDFHLWRDMTRLYLVPLREPQHRYHHPQSLLVGSELRLSCSRRTSMTWHSWCSFSTLIWHSRHTYIGKWGSQKVDKLLPQTYYNTPIPWLHFLKLFNKQVTSFLTPWRNSYKSFSTPTTLNCFHVWEATYSLFANFALCCCLQIGPPWMGTPAINVSRLKIAR